MADQEVQSNRIAIVKVPAIFWDDHFSRDLDFTSVEVSRSKLTVTLRMTDAALDELISDADYWSGDHWYGEEKRDNLRIINSAKSTLKSLVRQGIVTYDPNEMASNEGGE
jgi:hypothetical protein